jgi:hypothetical protein
MWAKVICRVFQRDRIQNMYSTTAIVSFQVSQACKSTRNIACFTTQFGIPLEATVQYWGNYTYVAVKFSNSDVH